ncbi:UNVERIFIED_CONTAM: hypothetical protein GTU68_003814 [Idotea baltica]|nr:hypothetical protein [Idotea baltica]
MSLFEVSNVTVSDESWPNGSLAANDTSWLAALQSSSIYRIQLCAIPFLVAFGGVGNVLSLWVFCTPSFRGHSSSCYLAALAASDTLFLLTLLVVWLSNTTVDLFNAQGWCQGVTYLTHVATFVSVWLVVAFTVERFIAVCYPLLRSVVCTVRRARTIVGGLFLSALLLYAYLLLAAGVERTPPSGALRCTLRDGYEGVASAMNAVDTILTLVLPVLAVLTLNARIAKCVYYIDSLNRGGGEFEGGALPPARRFVSRRRRGKGGGGGGVAEEGAGMGGSESVLCGANSATSRSTRKAQHNVTKMLLVISTIFILLNLPSYVIRLYMYFTVRHTNTHTHT